MAFTDMTTPYRATEDICLETGERCEHAIMTSVDLLPEKVHCTMAFEAHGTITAPQTDVSDNCEEDAEWSQDSDEEGVPELLSESESTMSSDSESDSESDNEVSRPRKSQKGKRRHRHQQAGSWQAY